MNWHRTFTPFYCSPPGNQVNSRANNYGPCFYPKSLLALLILLLPLGGCEKAKKLADNAVNKVKKDFQSAKDKLTEASKPTNPKQDGPDGRSKPNTYPANSGTIENNFAEGNLTYKDFEKMVPSTIQDSHLELLARDAKIAETVTELNLPGAKITAKGLLMLQRFPNLEALDLTRVNALAGNMKYVGDLKTIKHLVLTDNFLTDSDFSGISGLTGLESINLKGNRITDDGFGCFTKMTRLSVMILTGLKQLDGKGLRFVNKNSLKELNGANSSIGLFAFQSLGGSESLEVLTLIRAQVTDKTMQGIGKCKNLREVFLEGNNVTSKGVSYLRNCATIKKLDLSNNRQLGNDTMKYLIRLKAMNHLLMKGTQCSEVARIELLEHVPDCQFFY